MTTTNIRRQGQFKPGLDTRTGIRRVRNDQQQVTYLPLATIVGLIDLPTNPDLRKECQVPNGDQDSASYIAYKYFVTDGYLLVNDFRKNATGSALISIKEKQVKQQNGRVDSFFYIRLDDTKDPATHRIDIVDALAFESAFVAKVEGQTFFDLAVLKNRATGGIIVTPIA